MKVSIVFVIVCFGFIYCQEDGTEPPIIELPDSIPEDFDTNCLAQRAVRPDVCCEDDGSFCCKQCMLGICQCVDPETGMRLDAQGNFPEVEDVDCCPIITDPPVTATDPPVTATDPPEIETDPPVIETDPPVTATDPPETETDPPVTETDPPETETDPPVIETDPPEIETDPPEIETDPPETDPPEIEEPTDDDDDDDEDSDSSESSNSSRSSETSFSDSSRSTSGTRSTNGTRSTGTKSKSGRSGTTTGRSGTGRSGTSRKSGTSVSETSGRCPSVNHLLENGCLRECVVMDSDDPECPACNLTCNENLPVQAAECECTDSQECLRTGRFGQPTCVDLPGIGERCGAISEDGESEDSESRSSRKRRRRGKARRRITGASARRAVGQLNDVQLPCQDGLVCVSSSNGVETCQEQSSEGPCVLAQNSGRSVDCDAEGFFRPLQCDTIDGSSLLRCECVLPSSGTPLPGTEVVVPYINDAPDCSSRVFDGFDYERAGQLLSVPHGEYFVDIENCRRYLCNDGEATECEPSATPCTALQVQPKDCQYRGQVLQHGSSLQFDCNLCGCRNGLLSCTRAPQCQEEIADRCSTCGSSQQGLVCAPNGVTYRSECEAIFCAGHPPFTLRRGPCKDYDVCQLFPCQEDELCLRRGGVSCFALDGCDPDQLRLCVDPADLRCEDVQLSDSEDEGVSSDEGTVAAVCGTNGVTYPSLCSLIQDTGKEGVAYSGQCGKEECSGGPVCGSDGDTYDNICELWSQSANALVDYTGPCQVGGTPEDACARVNALGRCPHNTSNCQYLVKPEQGCCSICGGVVLMAIDFLGLGEYVKLNPRLQTLDDLLEVLLESEFISQESTDRCVFEASLTASGDIQLVLSARDVDTDAEFCWSQSAMLAQAVNSPSDSHSVPEVLQFASAAVSAPSVVPLENTSYSPVVSSWVSLMIVLFIVSLLL